MSRAAAMLEGRTEVPPSKREAILEAAGRMFLDRGYGAASMDLIAREANVSKQTIYSHFGGKAELFEAMVHDKCDELIEPIEASRLDGADPQTALIDFATRYLSAVLAPEAVAHLRTILAECVRFPELAEVFYGAGPKRAIDSLARYFARLDGEGQLRVADPVLAASQFLGALRGDLHIRRLLGFEAGEPEGDIEAAVGRAVGAFLAAHGRE